MFSGMSSGGPAAPMRPRRLCRRSPREDIREVAELTSDEQLLRIAELPEVPVSLEHLRQQVARCSRSECSAGPVRCCHLGCGPAGAGFCFGQHGEEEDQQPRDESPAARQHDTDDHEQGAGDEEDRPPAGPYDTCEP
jgi:hypothetical protein